MSPTLETEIQKQLSQLPLEQQRQVLEFARALATARVRGVPDRRCYDLRAWWRLTIWP